MPKYDKTAMQAELLEKRQELLKTALDHALDFSAYAAPAANGFPSDQHWLELFSSRTFGAEDAKLFIGAFDLERSGPWNFGSVATEVEKFRVKAPFTPSSDISLFAQELAPCTDRNRNQISAASKLATFIHPHATVFITDTRVRAALPLRPKSIAIKTAGGATPSSAFEVYSRRCQTILKNELLLADFREVVDLFDGHTQNALGPMSDRTKVPREFLERRILDKLLYLEGKLIIARRDAAKQTKEDATVGDRRP